MTDTLYYILYLFSILVAMVLGIAGLQTNTPSLVNYALLYGLLLPGIYALAIFVKWIFCMNRPQLIVDHVQLCPIGIRLFPFHTTIITYIVSLGLMGASTLVVLYILERLGYIVVIEQKSQILFQLSPVIFFYILLMQIPVGTMEEGVFRKAIPEAIAVIGGYPIFYAISISILFGLLHLYAYGNVVLTSTAISAGIVNSLIYYGYLGKKFAGNITSLALAHTTYNVLVMIFQEAPQYLILLFPLLGLIAFATILYFYLMK